MNVKSVTKLEKSMVELVIEASAEELEAAVQKAYQKQRKRIAIPGFRKGHAPRKIIEAMYGSNIFYDAAINDIYPGLFDQAVKQEKIDTVAFPSVEMVGEPSREGFTFKATVAVRPEVTLEVYKGLTAPKEEVVVTEEDVDQELRPYIVRATQLIDVEREAKLGDTVNIDYEGFIDGTAFDGGKEEGHDLELGSGAFIPGFEDQLVGVKADENRDVVVTFPEAYPSKDLAGKEATFKVKVHSVKEKQIPELDDEFAKDVSEFETLADFRDDLRKKLIERREIQAKNAFEEALLVKITENMKAEIPDAMVEHRAQRMLEDYSQRIVAQGIPIEQYLSVTGMTMEMLRQEAHEGALRQVKMDLALESIAKAEGLEVSAEEVEQECKRLSEQYGMTLEKVKEVVSTDQVRTDILHRKAGDIVFESAIEEKVTKGETSEKPAEAAPIGEVDEAQASEPETTPASGADETKASEPETAPASGADEAKTSEPKAASADEPEQKAE